FRRVLFRSAVNLLLPSALRALIIACSYWVLTLSLTSPSGSLAAVAGCLAGCLAVDAFWQRTSLRDLRLSVVTLGALVVLALGIAVSSWLGGSVALGRLLPPLFTYELSEIIQWLAFAASLSALLRLLAHRTSFGRVAEILFVATTFVITLAAH